MKNSKFSRISKAIPISSTQSIGTQSCLSPCSKYIATAVASRVTIRDSFSFEVLNIFACVDKVERVEFSPDSCYVLCGLYTRCTVQAFSLFDSTWSCRINENLAGLTSAKWSPDSRHIITVSDFGIQLAIWSLTDSCMYLVSSPKSGYSMSVFSNCGSYMAVAMRLDCKDYIGVYTCNAGETGTEWGELSKFKVHSNDLAAIQWSPSGTYLVINDSPLSYRLLVYTPAGEEVACYEAYSQALGVRSSLFCPTLGVDAKMSPRARYLAVSSYDGVVRLMSTMCWTIVFVLPMIHPREMRDGFGGDSDELGSQVVTTVEVEGSDAGKEFGDTSQLTSVMMTGAAPSSRSYVHRSLKVLPRNMLGCGGGSASKPPTLSGQRSPPVTALGWSPCGTWLASSDPEGSPRCIWVWEARRGRLYALLVQLEPVLAMEWRPSVGSGHCSDQSSDGDGDGDVIGDSTEISDPDSKPLLAFCTGSNRVYFWCPESGPSWKDVPNPGEHQEPVCLSALHWSRDGSHLLLTGRCGDQSYCWTVSDERKVLQVAEFRALEQARILAVAENASEQAIEQLEAVGDVTGAENVPPPPPAASAASRTTALKVSAVPTKQSKVPVAKPSVRRSSVTSGPVSAVGGKPKKAGIPSDR